MDHQKAATVDIHGAFMQANIEGETVNINTERRMTELLKKLNPKLYWKYVTNKKGERYFMWS